MSTTAAIRELVPGLKKNYPVRIEAWLKRSNGKRVRKTLKGRRIKSEETGYKYELSNGETTMPVPYKAIDVDQSGNEIVYLYSPAPGEWLPADFNFDDEEIQAIIDREGAEAYRKNKYNQKRQFYQKKKWWQQYSAEISIIVWAVAFILIAAGMMHFFGGIAESQVEAAQIFAEAAKSVKGG